VSDKTTLLGIDIGSSATKAVLVDPDRGVVASASRPVPLLSSHPGWAEADPTLWWANVAAVIQELLTSAAGEGRDVAAVACSGMAPAVLFLDGNRRPLRPAILQNDARSTREIDELKHELAHVDLLDLTGSVLSQQSVAPTVRWVQRNEPNVWRQTAYVVGSYDWLAMRLGAVLHVEQNWAIESGLFTLAGQRIQSVFAAVDLAEDKVPSMRTSGASVGHVTSAAAEPTGLRVGTPVIVGGADHVLSAFGAGLAVQGDWLVKLGGAGDVLAVSDQARTDARLYLDAHPVPGLWLPNGCMATSGSLLRWLQGIFGGPSFEGLDDEAERTDPAALICLPYFLGEKSPHHDPNLRGTFVGLHLGTTRADLYRSALEAIAYGFRQHMEIFEELGLTLGEPRITNGGSKSTLWKQILADVLGRPLVPVVDHPGASLGAALAAGIAIGAIDSSNRVAELVHTDRPIEPDRSRKETYQKGFEMFRELGPAVRPFSHGLARTAH
jgi:xylulokinase